MVPGSSAHRFLAPGAADGFSAFHKRTSGCLMRQDDLAASLTPRNAVNVDLTQGNQMNPDLTHPDLTHPDLTHPDLTHPDLIYLGPACGCPLGHPAQARLSGPSGLVGGVGVARAFVGLRNAAGRVPAISRRIGGGAGWRQGKQH